MLPEDIYLTITKLNSLYTPTKDIFEKTIELLKYKYPTDVSINDQDLPFIYLFNMDLSGINSSYNDWINQDFTGLSLNNQAKLKTFQYVSNIFDVHTSLFDMSHVEYYMDLLSVFDKYSFNYYDINSNNYITYFSNLNKRNNLNTLLFKDYIFRDVLQFYNTFYLYPMNKTKITNKDKWIKNHTIAYETY